MTNKHDTSSESVSGEGSTEASPTSTTKTASSTPLATITREVLPTAVTLVFQVGASPTGTTILLNSVSTALPSTPSATSLANSFTSSTSEAVPSPISQNPVQLANLEAHKIPPAPNHLAPIIGGVVGGVVGLALVAFAIFITTWLRRRRREREMIDSKLTRTFSSSCTPVNPFSLDWPCSLYFFQKKWWHHPNCEIHSLK
jgi:hypothetical protein